VRDPLPDDAARRGRREVSPGDLCGHIVGVGPSRRTGPEVPFLLGLARPIPGPPLLPYTPPRFFRDAGGFCDAQEGVALSPPPVSSLPDRVARSSRAPPTPLAATATSACSRPCAVRAARTSRSSRRSRARTAGSARSSPHRPDV
jgi:hypothetical protein